MFKPVDMAYTTSAVPSSKDLKAVTDSCRCTFKSQSAFLMEVYLTIICFHWQYPWRLQWPSLGPLVSPFSQRTNSLSVRETRCFPACGNKENKHHLSKQLTQKPAPPSLYTFNFLYETNHTYFAMPYLIYTPEDREPHVLDDEDANFLHYFDTWGCPYEPRPGDDPEVIRLARMHRRESLYWIQDKELRRRQKAEKKQIKAARKADRKSKNLQKVESKEFVRMSKRFSKSVLSLFIKEKQDKELGGYEEGDYVNHLAGLQREWFNDKGNILDRNSG